jgi:hypothetical protein
MVREDGRGGYDTSFTTFEASTFVKISGTSSPRTWEQQSEKPDGDERKKKKDK